MTSEIVKIHLEPEDATNEYAITQVQRADGTIYAVAIAVHDIEIGDTYFFRDEEDNQFQITVAYPTPTHPFADGPYLQAEPGGDLLSLPRF